MAQLIEDVLPPIQSAGLNTNKNVSLGGTLNVTGNATFNGTVVGSKSNVLSATTITTLTVAQSGSTILFNSTTGVKVILPSSPVQGLQYYFLVQQTPASGTHGISTGSAGVFLSGSVLNFTTATGTSGLFTANGSSNTVLGMSGSTTGGSVGTWFDVTCTSGTNWIVNGQLIGSGAAATPFA